MKHLKTYENINKPKLDDYVICKDNTDSEENNEFQLFLNNNIGQIEDIDNDGFCIVSFENLPDEHLLNYAFYTEDSQHLKNLLHIPNLKKYKNYTNLCGFECKEIVTSSPNKEKLKSIINANKYNL